MRYKDWYNITIPIFCTNNKYTEKGKGKANDPFKGWYLFAVEVTTLWSLDLPDISFKEV